MKMLRWLSFIPVATIAAIACGFSISGLFPSRSFDQHRLLLSLVSPWGLAPQIAERLIPVALCVVLGSMLAPSHGRKVVVLLGLLGGVFGWPFGPQYSLAHGHIFYAASAGGALLGCAIGMLLAFKWQRRRREEPIQTPQTTPESSTPLRV